MRLLLVLLFTFVLAAGASAQGLGPAEPPVPPIPGLPVFLSGVGASPISRNVNIRSGPGTDYPILRRLVVGDSLDVVGTNGFDVTRSCVGDFNATLDMWVQVQFAEQRGWVARCTVNITGDMSRLLDQTAP
jgi:uncharacterized protein YgiM (DUF1202 family)